MKLQKGQKIVLAITLSFFAFLIVLAIFISSNNKKDLDVPGDSQNAQGLQNKINEYYETKKNVNETIDTQSSTMNGIYMAIITTYKKSLLGDYNIPVFKAYYYDKKRDMQLARSEVLSAFNYDEDDIKNKIIAYFKDLYNKESEQGYVDKNECNFEECYLSFYRNLNHIDRYVLYGENGKLYAYISFDPDSLVGDKEFFDKLDYDYYKIEIN